MSLNSQYAWYLRTECTFWFSQKSSVRPVGRQHFTVRFWGIHLCASRFKQKCYRNLLLENNKRIEGFDSKQLMLYTSFALCKLNYYIIHCTCSLSFIEFSASCYFSATIMASRVGYSRTNLRLFTAWTRFSFYKASYVESASCIE